jgi:hypothetical protein
VVVDSEVDGAEPESWLVKLVNDFFKVELFL